MNAQVIKQEIKALSAQKGVLSHQIGEKKKTGESFDNTLKEIQGVSQRLKQLKETKKSEQVASVDTCEASISNFPAHIVRPQHNITIFIDIG